ncbi:MAG: glnG 1 [Gemmataceae bacterium]|nr:glnG 1 [Gemmataceae bacterium]
MPVGTSTRTISPTFPGALRSVFHSGRVRTDVRLIAATHRDLKAWSAEGYFRADLYYRLSVFVIHLPPLRERGDDLLVLVLVRHYLRLFSRELGREVEEVAPEALERLRGYTWPGNIRELQSVLKQALLQARGTTLLPAYLPALAGEPGSSVPACQSAGEDPTLEVFIRLCLAGDDGDQYAEAHRRLDRLFLLRVLEATGGNQQAAARRPGIARETLRRRLRELGLHLTRRVEVEQDETS